MSPQISVGLVVISVLLHAFAAPAAAQPAASPAVAPTAAEQLRQLRADVESLQNELAQTQLLLNEVREEVAATSRQITGNPDAKAAYELWRQARAAAEAERTAYNRERQRLLQAQEALSRTQRAADRRSDEHEQTLEKLRQPGVAQEPLQGFNAPGVSPYRQPSYYFYSGYVYPYFYLPTWPTRTYTPPYIGPRSPWHRPHPHAPTSPPATPNPAATGATGVELRVPSAFDSIREQQRLSDAARGSATPRDPGTVVVDTTATGSTTTPSLTDLRTQLEHLRARYPSQFRPDNSAYRVSGNPRSELPGQAGGDGIRVFRDPNLVDRSRRDRLNDPISTRNSDTRILDRVERQHFETRYPSESRGDNSQFRVSSPSDSGGSGGSRNPYRVSDP